MLPGTGSPTVLETEGEFVTVVPGIVEELTLTTRGKFTEAPTAMVCPSLSVQVKVPVPPAAMVLQVQFAGGVNETKVVPAGMASVNVALVSTEGPLLVTA